MGGAWGPLLDGDPARRARVRVEEVAAALLDDGPPRGDADHTIRSGSAGLAVVHTALADATGDEAHRQRAEKHLAHARMVVRGERSSPSLYDGFVGVAWAIEHLRTPSGPDPLAQIDAALVQMLERRSPWPGQHDLFDGLVGLGVYGLERLPRASGRTICELVVQRLAGLAQQRPGGLAWHTPARLMLPDLAEAFPDGMDNLGMAHGTPGVVAFLGACLAVGVAREPVARLVDDAVAWLLDQQLDIPGHRFPKVRATGVDPTPARAAWCYGDPSVAAALLVAGRGAGRADWEKTAVELAVDAAARTIEDGGVEHTALCHGAAGLAHLYARMHHATGDNTLADAARTWYGRVFAVPDPREKDGSVARGFLRGQGGVALALLAGLKDREPAWDRLLALSTPTGHGGSIAEAADR